MKPMEEVWENFKSSVIVLPLQNQGTPPFPSQHIRVFTSQETPNNLVLGSYWDFISQA